MLPPPVVDIAVDGGVISLELDSDDPSESKMGEEGVGDVEARMTAREPDREERESPPTLLRLRLLLNPGCWDRGGGTGSAPEFLPVKSITGKVISRPRTRNLWIRRPGGQYE